MNTTFTSKISSLGLVYPPISNQEAVWVQEDPEVEACLRESDFYMIGGRAEARFDNIQIDAETRRIRFDLVIGDQFRDPVELDVESLPGISDHDGASFHVEAGPKLIRFWDGPVRGPGSEVLEWFTTEKLIWDRGRERPGVLGLERQREAATYDLLYVGIAKVGDTYDRLIANGHKARMEILANEPQRLPGARVTDETFLFMFRVEPTFIKTFELGHDFSNETFDIDVEAKRVVADAEKAYVSLLRPAYNNVTFKSYPRGQDGLFGVGVDRYGYAICENLVFNTLHGRIQGGRDARTKFLNNDADAIFVEGTEVKLFLSGVDFPAEAAS